MEKRQDRRPHGPIFGLLKSSIGFFRNYKSWTNAQFIIVLLLAVALSMGLNLLVRTVQGSKETSSNSQTMVSSQSKENESGETMMQFLKHSQDPVMAEKMGLRGGVGLAAPQLDISKRIIAVLVPNIVEEGETPQEAYDLQAIMYNPKIVSHSVQDAALGEGEGCLSVDRNVPGYVIRHARVTVDYFDKDGEKHRIKLKGYNSIVVQHEIDHLNGIMFYDRINEKDPFAVKDGLLILE